MVFKTSRQRKAVMAKVKRKAAPKSRMPEGWAKVTWKDAQGRRFVDSIPECSLAGTKNTIDSVGGSVIKIVR